VVLAWRSIQSHCDHDVEDGKRQRAEMELGPGPEVGVVGYDHGQTLNVQAVAMRVT